MINIEITNKIGVEFVGYLVDRGVEKKVSEFKRLAKKIPEDNLDLIDNGDEILNDILDVLEVIGETCWDFLSNSSYANNEQAQAKEIVHRTVSAINTYYTIIDPYSAVNLTFKDHARDFVLQNFEIRVDFLMEDAESLEDLAGDDLLIYYGQEQEKEEIS